jgi:hypothetical protein
MDDFEKDVGAEDEITPEQFSLDDILSEFSDESLAVEEPEEEPDSAEPIKPREESDGRIETASVSDGMPAEPEPERKKEVQEAAAPAETGVAEKAVRPRQPEPARSDYEIVREYKPVGGGDLDKLLREVKLDYVTDEDSEPSDYASPEEPEPEEPDEPEEPKIRKAAPDERPPRPEKPERSFGERALSPLLALMAVISMRIQQRRSTVKAAPPEEAEDLGPETDPDRASRYYGAHISNLRTRLKIALPLCLVLMYISFGLPVFGRLNNYTVRSVMCLVTELAVMVVCLDIFTAGIMDLVRKHPGANSLISLSCIFSAVDAAVCASSGSADLGLPFCAVSALSITAALWASLLTCRGNRITLRTLAISKDPYTVTAESNVVSDGITLIKTKSDTENFVRRTEEITPDEIAYSTMAPWLIIAAVLLSLISAVVIKNFRAFPHILAAVFMPAAPLSALLAFPLPFSIVSRKIFHSGSAIAGWSGTYDIGGSMHIVVTDRDIFPNGTLAFESIRVLEGMDPKKIISYAGSVIAASGSGLSGIFTELMQKNSCALQPISEFYCKDSGGLIAMINGEEVLCGSSGFMQLMSIRLPQKIASKNSVYISVNGMISAIFSVSYTPVKTVQQALVTLLHSRRHPVFAVRDFNITPELLRHKFRMPSDHFDFPQYAKRFEISSAQRSPGTKIAAVISRDGLAPLVELSESGHKLYWVVRMCVFLSIMCTVFGMILMFYLCLTASFDSVTVGNMLLYLIIWMVPEFALTYDLRR